MKLTDPDSIKGNEKDFIDTINAEIDWEAIEKLLMEKHNFTLQDDVIYKEGDLVIHNNEIAYKFDFDIKVPLSVIFNRDGECLDIETMRQEEPESDAQQETGPENINPTTRLASDIADMISDINKEDE